MPTTIHEYMTLALSPDIRKEDFSKEVNRVNNSLTRKKYYVLLVFVSNVAFELPTMHPFMLVTK